MAADCGIDDLLRRALGEGVEVETVVAGEMWNTFVDAVQVENALLNLAINARDAMEGHGKLTIEAETLSWTMRTPLATRRPLQANM